MRARELMNTELETSLVPVLAGLEAMITARG